MLSNNYDDILNNYINISKEKKSDLFNSVDDTAKNRQEIELNSIRFKNTLDYLNNNYYNRKNKNLELKLFQIVGLNGVDETMYMKPDKYIKDFRCKKYEELTSFLDSLDEDTINSNIFLKNASIFVKTSYEDCLKIIKTYCESNIKSSQPTIDIETNISPKLISLIPSYINTDVINNTNGKITYVPILDNRNINIYKDNNYCSNRLSKIATDIYFLQMNNVINELDPSIKCYNFQICNFGIKSIFITTFDNSYLKNKSKVKEIVK